MPDRDPHPTPQTSGVKPAGRGRPKSMEKRNRLIDCGRALFLARGFEATSMTDVATEAGLARQTIYSHFESKEALFRAVIDDTRRRVVRRVENDAGSLAEAVTMPDTRAGLERFAHQYIAIVTDPELIALRRLAVAQSPHAPALRALWSDDGPSEMYRGIAAYLSRRADLRIDDPDTAAEQLLALIGHRPIIDSLFDHHSNTARPDSITSAIDLFLRAYQTPAPRRRTGARRARTLDAHQPAGDPR